MGRGAAEANDARRTILLPSELGGVLVRANLPLENIIDYYRTTGPIYAKAFAGRSSSGPLVKSGF